jgi:RNA polymerase sigma-70 factor (ECF subfamily)
LDDAELLPRLLAGEAAAWDLLVRRHAALLDGMVARVLGGAAAAEREDVVQSVFLKLWEDGRRRLRTFQGGCRLSTWLAAVARREALDRLRRRERHERHARASGGDGAPPRPSVPAEAAAQGAEDRARLDAALGRLPARDRLLVRLVVQDGCTYREAARLLQASENSIGPWLGRAQERLRGLLAPETGP